MAKKQHYENRPKSRREAAKPRTMSAIEAEGEVTQALGHENFRIRLDNGIEILGKPSGNTRLHHIRLLPGDRVKVEMSPYDLTRGRIVYRYRVSK